MQPEILIAIVAAVAVLLITYGVAARPGQDAVQARLSQLVVQPKTLEEYELQQPFYERTMRPLIKRLSKFGRRSDQGGVIARTDAKLEKAGYPGGLRGADWMGVKILSGIVFAIILFIVGTLLLQEPAIGFLMGLLGIGIGFVAPEFWLGRRIRARSLAMVLQLPDALDLLTISVEAGLGFDAALAKVVEKMDGPLVDEFRQALAEVRMGRTRRDALRDIVKRADAPPVGELHRRHRAGRAARRSDREGAPDPVAAAAHPAPPACGGGRGEGPGQDALPDGGLHLPDDLHRHPRSRHRDRHGRQFGTLARRDDTTRSARGPAGR